MADADDVRRDVRAWHHDNWDPQRPLGEFTASRR
jgi:hypothetical protein